MLAADAASEMVCRQGTARLFKATPFSTGIVKRAVGYLVGLSE